MLGQSTHSFCLFPLLLVACLSRLHFALWIENETVGCSEHEACACCELSLLVSQAGFFRFAAYNINDSESWHNYAACRQLAYGDYDGASECYLKAIEINPKDSHLQVGLRVRAEVKPESLHKRAQRTLSPSFHPTMVRFTCD